jgi:hypothetical protein
MIGPAGKMEMDAGREEKMAGGKGIANMAVAASG